MSRGRAVKIDREAQRKILEALNAAYPQRVDSRALDVGQDVPELSANLSYLEEHELVEAKWAGNRAVGNVKITARGIDFLAQDGGLSAILGVVTVRLHEEPLKALLETGVDALPQPETVRSKLKAQIRALPAEALKTITTELLKGALARLPDVQQWLTLLSPSGMPQI
jgi:hypothetical protein